eukprot:Pompholyxophrys_sp_v1_NODE_176_length_1340_cov_4.702955.p2 type:complete len:127 gc:universal NODE_176_length_1340_cov_4.702955:362-742(+)
MEAPSKIHTLRGPGNLCTFPDCNNRRQQSKNNVRSNVPKVWKASKMPDIDKKQRNDNRMSRRKQLLNCGDFPQRNHPHFRSILRLSVENSSIKTSWCLINEIMFISRVNLVTSSKRISMARLSTTR